MTFWQLERVGDINRPCYSKEFNETYGSKNKAWGMLELETHISIKQRHKALCPHGKGRKGENPSTGKVK